MKVCVLGTGQMALAILKLLEFNLKEVSRYGRCSKQLKQLAVYSKNNKYFDYKFNINIFTNNLDNFKKTRYNIIFYCLPVNCLDEKYYGENVIYTCKGIKDEYLFNKTDNYGLLYGPSYASEIINNELTCLTFSSKNEYLNNSIKQLFNNHPYCKIYYTKNIKEIEYYGIYKNIISLFCGILDSLHFGKNTVSYFIIFI